MILDMTHNIYPIFIHNIGYTNYSYAYIYIYIYTLLCYIIICYSISYYVMLRYIISYHRSHFATCLIFTGIVSLQYNIMQRKRVVYNTVLYYIVFYYTILYRRARRTIIGLYYTILYKRSGGDQISYRIIGEPGGRRVRGVPVKGRAPAAADVFFKTHIYIYIVYVVFFCVFHL